MSFDNVLPGWVSKNKIAWTKGPREMLPRHEFGVDWSSERKLLLDAKLYGRVFLVPGSTGWVCQGRTGYHEAHLDVQYRDGGGVRREDRLLNGGRFSIERLNQESIRKIIAKRLGLSASDLPELHPRCTWRLT